MNLLERTLRLIAPFLQEPARVRRPAGVPIGPMFSDPEIPAEGARFDDVVRETLENVLGLTIRTDSPRFIGHMNGAVPPVAHVADLLVSVMNQNLVKLDTSLSGTYVERQTLAWLHRLAYRAPVDFYLTRMHDPTNVLGIVVGGGTIGNLTALTVARNRALPGAAEHGMAEALEAKGAKRAVILAGARAHYSVSKAASLLGLGSRGLETLSVERFTCRVRLDLVRARLLQMRREGTLPIAIVGVAGSTETGSVDDLVELAALAREHGTWFHVDAAWGGALLLSDEHAGALQGIDLADSVVIDGHKLFGTTMGHGAVLFRDPTAAAVIASTAQYIVRADSPDLGRMSVEGSRPFTSFQVWFALKTLGKSEHARRVARSIENAKTLCNLIEQHDSFELTSECATNIVTYRYVPKTWRSALARHRSEGNVTSLATITRLLDAINIELQERQSARGESFVSRTRLESVDDGVPPLVVLRAIPFNPKTTALHLRAILAEQAELGDAIAAETWSRIDASERAVLPATGAEPIAAPPSSSSRRDTCSVSVVDPR